MPRPAFQNIVQLSLIVDLLYIDVILLLRPLAEQSATNSVEPALSNETAANTVQPALADQTTSDRIKATLFRLQCVRLQHDVTIQHDVTGDSQRSNYSALLNTRGFISSLKRAIY